MEGLPKNNSVRAMIDLFESHRKQEMAMRLNRPMSKSFAGLSSFERIPKSNSFGRQDTLYDIEDKFATYVSRIEKYRSYSKGDHIIFQDELMDILSSLANIDTNNNNLVMYKKRELMSSIRTKFEELNDKLPGPSKSSYSEDFIYQPFSSNQRRPLTIGGSAGIFKNAERTSPTAPLNSGKISGTSQSIKNEKFKLNATPIIIGKPSAILHSPSKDIKVGGNGGILHSPVSNFQKPQLIIGGTAGVQRVGGGEGPAGPSIIGSTRYSALKNDETYDNGAETPQIVGSSTPSSNFGRPNFVISQRTPLIEQENEVPNFRQNTLPPDDLRNKTYSIGGAGGTQHLSGTDDTASDILKSPFLDEDRVTTKSAQIIGGTPGTLHSPILTKGTSKSADEYQSSVVDKPTSELSPVTGEAEGTFQSRGRDQLNGTPEKADMKRDDVSSPNVNNLKRFFELNLVDEENFENQKSFDGIRTPKSSEDVTESNNEKQKPFLTRAISRQESERKEFNMPVLRGTMNETDSTVEVRGSRDAFDLDETCSISSGHSIYADTLE